MKVPLYERSQLIERLDNKPVWGEFQIILLISSLSVSPPLWPGRKQTQASARGTCTRCSEASSFGPSLSRQP